MEDKLKRAEKPAHVADSVSGESGDGLRAKILVVDDQFANILAMESLLEGVGADIVTAGSGQEALSLVLEHEFALALLDVQMPEMDGFETAALIRGRKQTRHLPLIFVTAISKDDEHIARGYETGAVDYLFKPVNPHVLRSKVEIFLELDRQRRLLAEQSRELDRKVQDLLLLQERLEKANQRLNELSLTDALTGLANRRSFQETLHSEWLRAIRNSLPLTLVLLDIDAFKNFNDRYGHLAGDDCLARIAGVVKSPLMRSADLAARYGGEEFAILLPGTDLKGGRHLAEEIVSEVEKLQIKHEDSATAPVVTISAGVASVVPTMSMMESELISAADKLLYRAKEKGRNQVVS